MTMAKKIDIDDLGLEDMGTIEITEDAPVVKLKKTGPSYWFYGIPAEETEAIDVVNWIENKLQISIQNKEDFDLSYYEDNKVKIKAINRMVDIYTSRFLPITREDSIYYKQNYLH